MAHFDFNLQHPLIRAIRALRHDPNAECHMMFLPATTLFWSDELPDELRHWHSGDPSAQLLWRMFDIRRTLWETGTLDDTQLEIWTMVKAMAPNWPLFRRLTISAEDAECLRNADAEVEAMFSGLISEATESAVGTDESGWTRIQANFDLTRPEDESADAAGCP